MQDLWTGIGRGVDGMVGQVVDWLGSGAAPMPSAPRPKRGLAQGTPGASLEAEPWADIRRDTVALVRFSIVSMKASGAQVIHADEVIEAGPLNRQDLESRVLRRYQEQHNGPPLERGEARVFLQVLKCWPREAEKKSKRRAKNAAKAAPTRKPPRRPAGEKQADPAVPADRVNRRAGGANSLDERLVDLLQGAEKGMPMRELVQETGERSGTLRLCLQRLIGENRVQRVGEGLRTLYRSNQDDKS